MSTITCTNHCRRCGGHFHSLEGFDLHRVFIDKEVPDWNDRGCDLAVQRRDGSPALELLGRGECRIANGRDDPQRDVEIWSTAGALADSERLAALRAKRGDATAPPDPGLRLSARATRS